MIYDVPKMDELDELMCFVRDGSMTGECSETLIYVYGYKLVNKTIAKYLSQSSVAVGYIVPEVSEADRAREPLQMISLLDVKRECDCGKRIKVIIAAEDHDYNQIISLLKLVGVDDFYIVSEWNKRAILGKMLPDPIEDFELEVNLVDQCNLNCQCCDHFSPIAEERSVGYEQYERDIRRLAELTGGKLGRLTLLGGEPLLNDRLIDYMKLTRELLPDSWLEVFTNGLLLPEWGEYEDDRNIWKAAKEYDYQINLTRYPISLNLDRIISDAKRFDIPVTFEQVRGKGARFWVLVDKGVPDRTVKLSVKHPLDITGQQEKYRFIGCYHFKRCCALKDGKIYTCPIIPHAHIYNERFEQDLQVTEDCYIDIYKVNSFEEIAEFVTHRTSFCDYCAVHKRYPRPWKQSEKTMEEWTL